MVSELDVTDRYWAVATADVATCKALNWAWASVKPYVLATAGIACYAEEAAQRRLLDADTVYVYDHERGLAGGRSERADSPDSICVDCERSHRECVCVRKDRADKITNEEHEVLSAMLKASDVPMILTPIMSALALRGLLKIERYRSYANLRGTVHVTDRGIAAVCAWHLEQLGKADTLPPGAP